MKCLESYISFSSLGPTLSNIHLRSQSASPSVDLMQFYILTQTLCWVDTGQWMRMRVFASTSFSNSSHQDHFTGLASAKESDFYNSTNTETNIRLSQSCFWHTDLKVQIKALSVWVITILRLVDECIVVRNILWIVVALMLTVISFQHSFWGVEEAGWGSSKSISLSFPQTVFSGYLPPNRPHCSDKHTK